MKEAPESALIRQSALLRGATEYVEVRYLRSRKWGVSNPAVFVLDLDDPIGYQIVSKAKTQKEIEELRAKLADEGVFRTVFWHMPIEAVADHLPDGFEEMAKQIRRWDEVAPSNTFPAIVATGSVMSVVAMPIPET